MEIENLRKTHPSTENLEASQSVQGVPPGLDVPAGQVMEQEGAPAVEEVPALQAEQE